MSGKEYHVSVPSEPSVVDGDMVSDKHRNIWRYRAGRWYQDGAPSASTTWTWLIIDHGPVVLIPAKPEEKQSRRHRQDNQIFIIRIDGLWEKYYLKRVSDTENALELQHQPNCQVSDDHANKFYA